MITKSYSIALFRLSAWPPNSERLLSLWFGGPTRASREPDRSAPSRPFCVRKLRADHVKEASAMTVTEDTTGLPAQLVASAQSSEPGSTTQAMTDAVKNPTAFDR